MSRNIFWKSCLLGNREVNEGRLMLKFHWRAPHETMFMQKMYIWKTTFYWVQPSPTYIESTLNIMSP